MSLLVPPVLYCWCTRSFACVVEVGIECLDLGAGPRLIGGVQVQRRRRVVGDAAMERTIIKLALKQVIVKLSVKILGSGQLGSIAAGAGAGAGARGRLVGRHRLTAAGCRGPVMDVC